MFSFCCDKSHGGSNMGTLSAGKPEKYYTALLGDELIASLDGLPIKICHTRSGDWGVSQKERGEISRNNHANFVMSAHIDAQYGGGTDLHGVRVYYWPGNKIALKIAQVIVDAFPVELRPGCAGGHVDPIIEAVDDPGKEWLKNARAVLGAHNATVVLPEICFGTNSFDRCYINTVTGRSAVVCALRAGVVEAWRLHEHHG